ncbi:uncharacterized protein CCOS01_00803 [Colletotrichum costaricense]|uniref:Uncharacterized protein n=2 Tax=Colletotrichum acutatum species complex TaxID=2707335 RepID=A0AAI9ZAB1_9PEZI|nr:uncharacterized protein CCOS01_00803 [Colletotrichum costaricense]XP_060375758.1 uncharacterized protein CTAM01_13662 [Colletotrichum tamarilloi]KAK1482209.1 hypothetical protein CTAM01_13662 [Colletotrichum tamarilloi]KAK1539489.1 hypothetical protein CCOS01_00803 [Colletotrichum costaricense]
MNDDLERAAHEGSYFRCVNICRRRHLKAPESIPPQGGQNTSFNTRDRPRRSEPSEGFKTRNS